MKRKVFHGRGQTGFSLIDALIAAVVLGIGLLALAALQASVTRNAADSRARSQIMAFVEQIVERQRAYGVSGNFALVPLNSLWTTAEVTSAQNAAGVSNLNLAMTATHYDGRTGSFVVTTSALPASAPQYKILRSVATWTDASGQARRLDLASVLSPRVISSSRLPYNVATGGSGSTAARPVVRITSPVVAGMVPIALGDGQTGPKTAATNPKPVISSAFNRTSYEVLTYAPATGNWVTQQRRIETVLIKCACTYGAATNSTDEVYKQAKWPAYWTGYGYEVYKPNLSVDPPGKALASGPQSGVSQDGLCTECCRDHHDAAGSTHVKFDPYRTDAHDHYRIQGGSLVKAGANESYLEACRMVRVDGFWRTAQDMSLKHLGFIETGDLATNPLPATATAEKYNTFAKTYLKENYVPGTSSPRSAEVIYEANGLNAPSSISIFRPEPADERYLHARGFYVDNVEPLLQAKIQTAYDNCSRADKADCVLPLLAFTAINLTEIAYYASSSTDSITVDTDGFVEFRPSYPRRGRVNAVSSAPSSPDPFVTTSITKSNAGVAVVDRGIDPEDDVKFTDSQTFKIAGTQTGGSGIFNVVLTGLGTPTKTPAVAWVKDAVRRNCQGTNLNYKCITSFSLPASLSLSVSAYNQQQDRKVNVNVLCQNGVTYSYKPNGQEYTRYCRNFTPSVASGPASLIETLRDGNVGNIENGANSEATVFALTNMGQSGTVTINFQFADEKLAPRTCEFSLNNDGSIKAMTGVVWKNCSDGEL